MQHEKGNIAYVLPLHVRNMAGGYMHMRQYIVSTKTTFFR